jgi:hypothetical protein
MRKCIVRMFGFVQRGGLNEIDSSIGCRFVEFLNHGYCFKYYVTMEEAYIIQC